MIKRTTISVISGALLSARIFAADVPATIAPATNATVRQAQERAVQAGRPQGEPINDEQRQKVRQITEKYREEQRGLNEKLRTLRRELEQTAQADPVDEKAVHEKANAMVQIEADLAIIRGKQYREMRAIMPTNAVAAGIPTLTNRLATIVTNRPAAAPTTLPNPNNPPPKK